MSLQEQIKQPYVGNVIELFKIDATVLGGPIQYLTPSGMNVSFGGQAYMPFPIQLSNKTYDAEAAPSRPTMTVSATKGSILLNMILAYGDLVGAKVTYKKTFANFLDGAPDANPNEHFPEERFIIIQRSALSPSGVTFVLSTQLDQPMLLLPRRQILRDNVGGQYSLYAPGVSRVRRV